MDCPLCGESLKKLKGVLQNSKGNSMKVYACEECDQAFGLTNDGLAVAPFDAEMKPIKEICKVCDREEHFRQKMTYIINDDMRYDTYCKDCAVEFLRNWLMNEGQKERERIEHIDHDNVDEIAEVYEVQKANKILSDPEKLAKIKKDYERRTVG